MSAPVIGAAYTMTTKREAHWSEQTKAQNTEKGTYVGLKQPRGDGERYVTPARAAAKETIFRLTVLLFRHSSLKYAYDCCNVCFLILAAYVSPPKISAAKGNGGNVSICTS